MATRLEQRRLRAAGIVGLGMYVPDRVLTNNDLERMVDTTDEWIVSRTGIRERRIAGEDQATSDLALPAAHQALQVAGIRAADLDLIIVATYPIAALKDARNPALAREWMDLVTSEEGQRVLEKWGFEPAA